MLEQTPSEIVQLRILLLKENRKTVILSMLVREARCFVELLQRDPLIAAWAREWLARANEQLDGEAPQ